MSWCKKVGNNIETFRRSLEERIMYLDFPPLHSVCHFSYHFEISYTIYPIHWWDFRLTFWHLNLGPNGVSGAKQLSREQPWSTNCVSQPICPSYPTLTRVVLNSFQYFLSRLDAPGAQRIVWRLGRFVLGLVGGLVPRIRACEGLGFGHNGMGRGRLPR